ncbi:hypothetical protein EV426DRAFT_573932 [Tirmania nivea]|nr:hypothetical protein EV426DRAFT_573932 [Tirmania nivea]
MASTKYSAEIHKVTGPAEFSAPRHPGVMDFPQWSSNATQTLAELIHDNHEKHHIFFDEDKRHNHAVHYLLALYDFGASSSILKATYEREKYYQRPPPEVHEKVLQDLSDESKWNEYIEKAEYYSDFLAFFTKEIKELGWKETVKKWLFRGTPVTERLFVNITSGLYHPLIHLGYGIEFQIPAVIAEGLAQFATTDFYIGDALLDIEKAAKEADPDCLRPQKNSKTLLELANEIYDNPAIARAAEWEDGNKFKAVIARAGKELAAVALQWRCKPENVIEKAAEAGSGGALLCVAATRPDKATYYDFFLMHCLTSTLFLHVLIGQDWIPTEAKCRMLQLKVWTDLLTYASRGAPKLYASEVQTYVPKVTPKGNPWLDIIDRILVYEDKTVGHGVKVVRALAHGEQICRPYVGKPGFVMEGDMWWKAAAILMDYLEEGGREYIFSVGFEEAWAGVGPKKRYGNTPKL